MPLTVNVVRREYGVSIVSPCGEIDTVTAPVLEREMETVIAGSPRVLILDMNGVEYISSAGLSALIRARKAMKEGKAELVIVNLRPRVRRVFEIVNALPREQIFESTEEMDRYLAGIQREP